jgi:formamidopyrimidine-DNA glycosylase
MPELPEVETTAKMLDKRVKGLVISSVWTDYDSAFHKGKGNIKDKKYFAYFKKELEGKKILGVRRRAKNVLIDVSGNKTILTHMKMTGHFLYGRYEYKNKRWSPVEPVTLKDPFNRFVHLVFTLSNGRHLALSDTRKFAKIFVFDTDKADRVEDIQKLGPEPLGADFTYNIFKQRLMERPTGRIKSVLMDQEIIAGIGNIYSDESLWASGIHPEERVNNIPESKLKNLFKNVIKILRQSIGVGGDSMSDYRNPDGIKGGYQNSHKVYRRVGEKCLLRGCKGIIRRIKVGGRSAHFCDCHQVLNK